MPGGLALVWRHTAPQCAAVVVLRQLKQSAAAVACERRAVHLRQRARRQFRERMNRGSHVRVLHREVGPAPTSLNQVAERAGVQRNTRYSHFPDERSLFMACSALSLECDPLPDAATWSSLADRDERLRVELAAIYAWYGRDADLAGCVMTRGPVGEPDIHSRSWCSARGRAPSPGVFGLADSGPPT